VRGRSTFQSKGSATSCGEQSSKSWQNKQKKGYDGYDLRYKNDVNTQLQLEHAKTNSASQIKTSHLRDESTLSVLSHHTSLETKDFEHSQTFHPAAAGARSEVSCQWKLKKIMLKFKMVRLVDYKYSGFNGIINIFK
jgi:hypothetical protein